MGEGIDYDWVERYWFDEMTYRESFLKPKLPEVKFEWKHLENPCKEIPMGTKPKFDVGDKVRLTTGSSPLIVQRQYRSAYTGEWEYQLEYLSGVARTTHKESNLVAYEKDEEMTTEKKLYEIKETSALFDNKTRTIGYGHKLAVNSKGEWVMEIKGSGEIMAVSKDQVEEVLPYTIDVQFSNSSNTYAYLAEAGEFQTGFYIVEGQYGNGWQIAQVVKVDTKSRKATKKFKTFGKIALDNVPSED